MNLSFQEKSLWVELITTLYILGYYLTKLMGMSTEQLGDFEQINTLLLRIVIFTIGVMIISHIVLAIFNPKTAEAPLDEREKLIELKANRYGLWVLQVGVVASIVLQLFEIGDFREPSLTLPFASLHLLVTTFVISELINSGSQLWFTKKGV